MTRTTILGLAAILAAGSVARGQYIAPGSTVEGDYLRGVGVAAAGMGQYLQGAGEYNRDTALAGSIEADTNMRLDAYLKTVHAAQNQERARNRIARQARFTKALTESRKRLLDNPETRDYLNGDAQNAVVTALSRFTASELGSSQVPMPADVVRKIPFKINEKGLTVSIPRMLHRNSPWPPAFQDSQFARERADYDRAMSEALDQFVELNLQQVAIAKVEKAIEALEYRLKRRGYEGRDYHEAAAHIADLKKYTVVLQHQMAQDLLVDLDAYSGTTMAELLRFMVDHKVQFDVAVRPEEKAAYREIYIALDAQRKLVDGGATGPDK